MRANKVIYLAVLGLSVLIGYSFQRNAVEYNQGYNYDADWEVFKEAVLNKDIRGVSAFAASDEIDAEDLIQQMSEDYIIAILKKTTYDDLVVDEQGDIVYLVFNAYETATDEEGNEVGTGISVYFSQGDPSLMLEYYIMAG